MSCSAGNAKMLEGFPTVQTLSMLYCDELYEINFFGGLVSTTFGVSTHPAWDSTKTDYQIGDRVHFAELKTDYICGEAGNMEFPPASPAWEPVASNDYRQIDDVQTSKSVSTADTVTNIYDVSYMNYLVGCFIDGVSKITVDVLDDNMSPTGEVLGEVVMSEIVDYTCFSCCNPPPYKKRFFRMKIDPKNCNTRYIRVVLTRSLDSYTINVGTLTVVRAVDAGVPNFDTRVKTDNGIGFERTKITKNIRVINMGATITVSGKSRISPNAKNILYKNMIEYNGVTFTIFDIPELEVIEGVVMGKFEAENGLQIGLSRDTEYQFRKQGVLA